MTKRLIIALCGVFLLSSVACVHCCGRWFFCKEEAEPKEETQPFTDNYFWNFVALMHTCEHSRHEKKSERVKESAKNVEFEKELKRNKRVQAGNDK